MNLSAIQSALRERNIDAWLFYDHHRRDPIAYRVLGLPDNLMVTRRWYYLVPAEGEPTKLVHKIEAGHLDSLPGTKKRYSAWQELFEGLKTMLATALNAVALVEFIIARAVAWTPGLAMMTGAILGGYAGATLARRIDRRYVRRFVIVIAWSMTIYFFVR